ncbi:O-antigen ligase family protein [Allobranchiibius sp. GilTou38]|uniref:O-antigen ligase family protein n=1 Tax=Allobranchiibius sp. GilTou38 TaxID=2815210 RepID=UPI001AA154B1|nr:O-antigen ligase family protein [Allobranchiibius sp. GilTou38]MBO1765226.1 hypothetical protein [Allobranchiibius sp. GilTou38]
MTLLQERSLAEHRQPKDADVPGALERMDNPKVISATLSVLAIFASLAADKYGAGLPVPPSSLLLGAAVFGAAFVVPTRGVPRPNWGVWLTLAIPGWLLVSSYLNHISGTKRLANLGMEALLVLVIASGRLCVISAARGAGIAVVLGSLWGLGTLGANGYVGRLVGGWGDPNNAGLCLVVLGCVAFAYVRTRLARVLIAVAGASAVFATFSRTSLFAMVIVILWVVVGDRVQVWVRVVVVGSVMWYVHTLPATDYATGIFAGRGGSDALRRRISRAERLTVSEHPLYGHGAGSARTNVDGDTFYFHNSYLALRAEGGWILLLIVVTLYALLLWNLLRLPAGHRKPWIEASLIGVLVCAANLGEVFLAPPAMIAVGVALRHLALSRRRIMDPNAPPPLGLWERSRPADRLPFASGTR